MQCLFRLHVGPVRLSRLVPTIAFQLTGILSYFKRNLLMPKSLVKYRHQAFVRQSKRCHYCGYPLWEGNPEQFAREHRAPLAAVKALQCTAEHLTARQDGGTNSPSNIAAACLKCNQGRHHSKPAPSAEVWQRAVKKQVKNNSWHRKSIAMKLSGIASI